MARLTSAVFTGEEPGMSLLRPFGERRIRAAFHDIDGTHSLIRAWEPVMSAVLSRVIREGLPDAPDEAERMMAGCMDALRTAETDRFCVESAGLSALTQMEWALRRAFQEGVAGEAGWDDEANAEIVRRIWAGEEEYGELECREDRRACIARQAPALFRLYERVLYRACRDGNLAEARRDPRRYLVPGSLRFLSRLREAGVRNYFVTGSIVRHDESGRPAGGIYEEAVTLGLSVGPGGLVEDLYGSRWDEKKPKPGVMSELAQRLDIPGEELLVVGDGRSEIAAGVEMGALCISRLPPEARRQREIHSGIGTHLIVEDFNRNALMNMIREEQR
ncbi:HAD family hydrolase [Kiritimatiella glycovorans]|uniref:Uncharacterized protein n=1 Tax=Kiritimatiella glycovorans TaxID=1307763 RepID=A0A0G3EFW2_9BACT|nr:HAD family hydrolase [Kiritimatiella glycovorans]AKJ63705.1 hypothetical protein L21SP4_00425 [Kiritimatiella glycovorans]